VKIILDSEKIAKTAMHLDVQHTAPLLLIMQNAIEAFGALGQFTSPCNFLSEIGQALITKA